MGSRNIVSATEEARKCLMVGSFLSVRAAGVSRFIAWGSRPIGLNWMASR